MHKNMFAILAEPNHIDIIELLYKSPRTVNEIAVVLKLNQPQTSKHLRILADAGVVDMTPIENRRMYSLTQEPFKDLDVWLSKFGKNWESRFARLEKLVQKEVKKHGRT